ncbi:hypothetical protein NP493_1331g00010 [Ridgeia piscesae]|uniref:Uncharacterized protein n=1 Tax=Ridgeia piscesae TaxID=27915 RepID=A0AAD9K8Z8_RIDPI|nr:hypothetical protein NP493_1331g00010 [Ridgeia piscesae]
MRKAEWEYINNTITQGLQTNNSKPFWKYIKSRKQDNIGVAPLKKNGSLVCDSKEKAEILLDQFQSVFTRDGGSAPPHLDPPQHPIISDININTAGVCKLLKAINPHKACGPDQIPNVILKNCADTLSPALRDIFQRSLDTAVLPSDWRTANVSAVFKKGDKHLPENYRPISLTSVPCKILEHIIYRHLMTYLEEHNILTDLNHGFRAGFSCETQLLTTMHDLFSSFDTGTQTDMAVLDFSKAFDTVPHSKLLTKLSHYGIGGTILEWLNKFLTGRTMKVVLDGILTAINSYNVRWATRVQDVFTYAKVLALLLIIGTGMVLFFHGNTENFKEPFKDTRVDVFSISLAFYQGLFAYNAWNYLNCVIEELKNPAKNLPKAIWFSLIFVTAIYMMTNIAYYTTVSPMQMVKSTAVAVTFTKKPFGVMWWIIPICVALSTFGGVNGILFTTARLFYVGSRQGHMPQVLSMVQVNKLTPAPAVIFMGFTSLLYHASTNIVMSVFRGSPRCCTRHPPTLSCLCSGVHLAAVPGIHQHCHVCVQGFTSLLYQASTNIVMSVFRGSPRCCTRHPPTLSCLCSGVHLAAVPCIHQHCHVCVQGFTSLLYQASTNIVISVFRGSPRCCTRHPPTLSCLCSGVHLAAVPGIHQHCHVCVQGFTSLLYHASTNIVMSVFRGSPHCCTTHPPTLSCLCSGVHLTAVPRIHQHCHVCVQGFTSLLYHASTNIVMSVFRGSPRCCTTHPPTLSCLCSGVHLAAVPRIHQHCHVCVQGFTSLLYLASTNIESLINYVGFVNWLAIGMSVLALLYFRWKRPDAHRPIKVWIGLPIIYVICSLFLTIVPIYASPMETGMGILIMASGVPVYLICVSWKKKPEGFYEIMATLTTAIQKLLLVVPEEKAANL